jgi:hypothetical protein
MSLHSQRKFQGFTCVCICLQQQKQKNRTLSHFFYTTHQAIIQGNVPLYVFFFLALFVLSKTNGVVDLVVRTGERKGGGVDVMVGVV